MLNEYELKVEGTKPQSRPARKHFERDDLIRCTKAKGYDQRFDLDTNRNYQVRDWKNGAVALWFMDHLIYYEAARFQLIEGQPEPVKTKPFRGIPIIGAGFKGVAA